MDILEFNVLEFVFFSIISISLAELAIQITISDLAHWMKGAILLNQPYHKKLDAVCNLAFWRKLFNKAWIIATPIIFLACIHRFFSQLLACPWCTGFWLMFFTNHFYLKQDIITALILAPMCLVWVTILDRLHTK